MIDKIYLNDLNDILFDLNDITIISFFEFKKYLIDNNYHYDDVVALELYTDLLELHIENDI